jgi:hypothetical protein
MAKAIRIIWDVLAIAMLAELAGILWSYLTWASSVSEYWASSWARYFYVPWLGPLVGVEGHTFEDFLVYEVVLNFFLFFAAIRVAVAVFVKKRRSHQCVPRGC